MEEFKELQIRLSEQLPSDVVARKEHGDFLDGWRTRVCVKLAGARKILTEEENTNQLAKSKFLTDMDRKSHVGYKTREYKEVVEVLESYIYNIDKRINWLQTTMKWDIEEYKRP